jgi:hypothetical protein
MLLVYPKKFFAGVEPDDEDEDEDGSDFGC